MARRGEMLKASAMGDEKRHRRASIWPETTLWAGPKLGHSTAGTSGEHSRQNQEPTALFARELPLRLLWFREDAGRCGSLADSDCIFGIAFLRGCYHKILGPRRHIPKFGNGLCRHPDIWVYFDPHLIWQACKGYVERGDVLRFVSH
jgi:hypothetical protein